MDISLRTFCADGGLSIRLRAKDLRLIDWRPQEVMRRLVDGLVRSGRMPLSLNIKSHETNAARYPQGESVCANFPAAYLEYRTLCLYKKAIYPRWKHNLVVRGGGG